MKKSALLAVILVWCLIMAGCGVGQGGASAGDPSSTSSPKVDNSTQEPVTIKVMQTSSISISDDAFQAMFIDPVKAKYPNITVQLVRNGQGTTIDDLITTGDIPDMLIIWNGQMPDYKKYGMFMDISPLIKKQNVDINRFEPVVLDAIRVVSDSKELYGLPYTQQLNALYYNKDIFDKFGVQYPKDGMTWDNAIELAKKLSREDGGVKYKGLNPEHLERLSFPLGLEMVDAKTNKSIVNNDKWKQVLETAYKIYSVPGNSKDSSSFYKDKNVAMFAGFNIFDKLVDAAKTGFTNWDVAQYPSYPDLPNTYGMVDTHVLIISKMSKHPDEAMKVISIVTSDEVQLVGAKNTLRLTPLKNQAIQKAIGADNPIIKDKHIDSIFKSKPAPAPVFSPNHGKAKAILYQSFDQYLADSINVNTALREADDKINQMLASQ